MNAHRLRTAVAILIVIGAASLLMPLPASASTSVRYGVQDDAWLPFGPGTHDERVGRDSS
jgi:hypothetical protein